jgi:hypothetical protein
MNHKEKLLRCSKFNYKGRQIEGKSEGRFNSTGQKRTQDQAYVLECM